MQISHVIVLLLQVPLVPAVLHLEFPMTSNALGSPRRDHLSLKNLSKLGSAVETTIVHWTSDDHCECAALSCDPRSIGTQSAPTDTGPAASYQSPRLRCSNASLQPAGNVSGGRKNPTSGESTLASGSVRSAPASKPWGAPRSPQTSAHSVFGLLWGKCAFTLRPLLPRPR